MIDVYKRQQLEDAVLPPGVADGRAAGQLHIRIPRLPVIPHLSLIHI